MFHALRGISCLSVSLGSDNRRWGSGTKRWPRCNEEVEGGLALGGGLQS